MVNIEIRTVTADDVEQLQNIGKKTFYDTFSASNTEDDMEVYLQESFSTDKLIIELNNPSSIFYFAMIDNNAVGYIKLNFGESQTELKGDKSIEIERLYVLKEFHGEKVGQSLYNKAIKKAHELKVEYIWLGVWENNMRARSFYKKNGFVDFDSHVFKLGSDEQIDIMMKKRIFL